MLSSISKSNLDDAIVLFSSCFGDSREVAREFFSCRDIDTVCIYVGDRLAAMASLIPINAGKIRCSLEQMSRTEKRIKGFYVYGVCVSEEYRGGGLFFSVMKKAEEKAICEDADFLCLIPADEGLASTYHKWGYDTKVIPFGEKNADKKNLFLLSDDFRKFAYDDGYSGYRMYGLIKSLNKSIFSPYDGEYAFGDCMGDV